MWGSLCITYFMLNEVDLLGLKEPKHIKNAMDAYLRRMAFTLFKVSRIMKAA
jgi:hypothetical protein